jgi:hypothetical protein
MSAILFDAPRIKNAQPTTTEIVTSYTDDGHGLPILVILSDWKPRLQEYRRKTTFRVEEVPASGGRGFILHRNAEDVANDGPEADDAYQTFIANPQDHHCTCKGHGRHGYCRHVDALMTLLAAGHIDHIEAGRPDDVTDPGYLLDSDLELLEPDPDVEPAVATRHFPAGTILAVGSGPCYQPGGDKYIATGRCDDRGQPLLVGADCPEEIRHEFEVPADGIELRHGPLTVVAPF